jgi:hypothetical protein
MDNRLGWSTIVLATTFLVGCQTGIVRNQGVVRTLTGLEMDEVTAGSAAVANDTAAHALGSNVQTNALASATAYSGTDPIAAAPYFDHTNSRNYTNSQTVASASSDVLTKTTLSNYASVEGTSGGVSIDVTADGSGTSRAQVDSQLYGVSTDRADIVFGSAAAVACCGSNAAAQVTINSRTGGPYSKELRAAPVSDTPGQTRDRVDVAVVSSALPILDSAQVLAAAASARMSPKY